MPVSTTVLPSPLANVNPNYLVSISGTDELNNPIGGFLPGSGEHHGIIAVLPEEFAISTSSSWAPLLNSMAQQMLGSAFGGKLAPILDKVGPLGGFSAWGTGLTQLVWESTTPIEFRLPLMFNAVYDTQTEVMLPIMQLLSMTLPSSVGDNSAIGDLGINKWLPLRAPGPNIIGSSKYKVGINIGQAFTFSNVLIKSVNATFKTLSVQSGDFISADVELEVSTTRILTKSDLYKYFNHGYSSNTTLG